MMDAEKLLTRLDRAIAGRLAKARDGDMNAVGSHMSRQNAGRYVGSEYGTGDRKRLRAPVSGAGNSVNNMRFRPGMFYARFTKKGGVEPVMGAENASLVPYVVLGDNGEYVVQRYSDGRIKEMPLTYNDPLLRDAFSDPPGLPVPYELETETRTDSEGNVITDADGRPVEFPIKDDDGRFVYRKDGVTGEPVKLKPRVNRDGKLVQTYQINPDVSLLPYNSPGVFKDAMRILELQKNGATLEEALEIDEAHRQDREDQLEHRAWLRNVAGILSELDEASHKAGGGGILDRRSLGWLKDGASQDDGDIDLPDYLVQQDLQSQNPYFTPYMSRFRQTDEGIWNPDKAEEVAAFAEDTPLDTYHLNRLMDHLGFTYSHDRDQEAVERRKDRSLDRALKRLNVAMPSNLSAADEVALKDLMTDAFKGLTPAQRKAREKEVRAKAIEIINNASTARMTPEELEEYRVLQECIPVFKAGKVAVEKEREHLTSMREFLAGAIAGYTGDGNDPKLGKAKEQLANIDMRLRILSKPLKEHKARMNELRNAADARTSQYDKDRFNEAEGKAKAAFDADKERIEAIPDAYDDENILHVLTDYLPELKRRHPETWGTLGEDEDKDFALARMVAVLHPDDRSRLMEEGILGLRPLPEHEIKGRYWAGDRMRSQAYKMFEGLRRTGAANFNKDHGDLSDKLMAAVEAKDPDTMEWLARHGYGTGPADRDEAAMILRDFRANVLRRREKETEYRTGQSAQNSIESAKKGILDGIRRDYGWNEGTDKALMDRLLSFRDKYVGLGRNKGLLKEWLAEQKLSGNKARRLVDTANFIQSTDPEFENGKVYAANARSLGRVVNGKSYKAGFDAVGGKEGHAAAPEEIPVSRAILNMYNGNRDDDFMSEGDTSVLYLQYRKDIEKQLRTRLNNLYNLTKNIDPDTDSSMRSFRQHLLGLSGRLSGVQKGEYLKDHPEALPYAKMLETFDIMMDARRAANKAPDEEALEIMERARVKANRRYNDIDAAIFGRLRDDGTTEYDGDSIMTGESMVDSSVPGTDIDAVSDAEPEKEPFEGTGYEVIPRRVRDEVSADRGKGHLHGQKPTYADLYADMPPQKVATPGKLPGGEKVEEPPGNKLVPYEPPKDRPDYSTANKVDSDGIVVQVPRTGETTVLDPSGHQGPDGSMNEVPKVYEPEKTGTNVSGLAETLTEYRADNKTASASTDTLKTDDAISKDMDDEDLGTMSLGDMMSYIEKKGGKDGHPYGLPVQGSVFAYGSIRNTMGHGKSPAFDGRVKELKANDDGLTVKKLNVGRVEPSDVRKDRSRPSAASNHL